MEEHHYLHIINPNTWQGKIEQEPKLPLLELQSDRNDGFDHPIRPPEIITVPVITPIQYQRTDIPSLQSIFVKTEKVQDLSPYFLKMKPPKFKRKAKKRTRRKPLKLEQNFDDDTDSLSGEYDRDLSKKLGFKARRIPISMAKGRKPRVTKRWKLFCAHCEVLFFARPTPKNSRYVVNHNCCSKRRKQYIIGVKTRGCVTQHSHSCIQRLA